MRMRKSITSCPLCTRTNYSVQYFGPKKKEEIEKEEKEQREVETRLRQIAIRRNDNSDTSPSIVMSLPNNYNPDVGSLGGM